MPDTWARKVAEGYFAALVAQNWNEAYTILHPASRKTCTAEQFARLAKQYRNGLGFEPDDAHVRLCSEQGKRALAHVVLTGQGKGRIVRFKDGITLQRSAEGWGVILPAQFGRSLPRPG